jgi:apolipoprotein N-acyltransferase
VSAKLKRGVSCVRRCLGATALVISLSLSALLMVIATGSSAYSWLAWFSLLPLFLCIRLLRPIAAMLAGFVWGICFYFFSVAFAAPAISPTFQSFALLTIAPALYACFGALLTRWVGFNPLLLGIGWVLVEVAIKPLGLQQGLLAGAQSQSPVLHWISRMLGYAFVAFLVVCVNASLLVILSNRRLKIPCQRALSELSDSGKIHLSQTLLYLRLITIFRGHPRAPPLISTIPA